MSTDIARLLPRLQDPRPEPAEETQTSAADRADRVVDDVACLGCGCTCDDISVVVRGGRITEARRACTLGIAWFGDGTIPMRITSDGNTVSLDTALADAARILAEARRTLVFLAPNISCETQRAGTAIADLLHSLLDSVTTQTAGASILAAQRRGCVSATLGEIRNRADLIVFWGVDPGERYPRYTTRYAPHPSGVHVPGGRRDRTVIAVDIGPRRASTDADQRIRLETQDEVTALEIMRAVVRGRALDEPRSIPGAELLQRSAGLAGQLMRARYAVIVHDAESSGAERAEALIALAQALNGPTRCALSALRGGGNQSGADMVMTWQTGFPMAVDFARGYPRYRPDRGAASLAPGDIDAALVIGQLDAAGEPVAGVLARARTIFIGPRASQNGLSSAVAIDTGIAGIHEGGTAFRMDEIPLPLRPAVDCPLSALDVARALYRHLVHAPAVTR